MPGPYQQLADPNQLADAGQYANSPEFWKALMALQQQQPDTLVPPPRNPAAPADWAANAVRGAAGKISDIVTLPGRAMQQGITTEEAVPWATDTALNLAGGGAPMAERGAAGAFGGRLPVFEGPIRAYHSSPHDFEKFDLGKLRTGEGANTYGAGIYAAESPEVSGVGGSYYTQFLRRFPRDPAENYAIEYLKSHGYDREAAANSIQKFLRGGVNESNKPLVSNLTEAARRLQSGEQVGPRTYEVGINARPDEFLNLDKPLIDQGDVGKRAFEAIHNEPLLPPTVESGAPDASEWVRKVGGLIGPEKFSARLNEAGIPGSRYLDSGSRVTPPRPVYHPTDGTRWQVDHAPNFPQFQTKEQAEEYFNWVMKGNPQTHNYVVFDPSKIDIYRKYGMAGAVPTAGLAAAASQQDR